jgi:hypothetical protein
MSHDALVITVCDPSVKRRAFTSDFPMSTRGESLNKAINPTFAFFIT